MKLLKMVLLAAFVPALAIAAPPPSPDDSPGPAQTPDTAPKPSDSNSKQMQSDHAPFGMTVKALTTERRQSYGGPKDAGLLVTHVDAGSPAAKAGVKAGDIVTKVDNTPVAESSDLDHAWMQDMQQSKSQASIEIVRDRKTMNMQATLDQGSQNKMQEKPKNDMEAPK